MDKLIKYLIAMSAAVIIALVDLPILLHAQSETNDSTITEWEMLWELPGEQLTIEQVGSLQDGWFDVHTGGEYPELPEGVSSAWLKIQLPELAQMRPALLFNKLYGKNIVMYIDKEIVYERYRNYSYDLNEIVMPVGRNESNGTMYIHMSINLDRIGLHNEIIIGEYDNVFKQFLKNDLLDVVMGAALVLISFFMMISVLFINKSFQPGWNSVFLIMLSIGIMILTYSAFLDKFFPDFGILFYVLFDVASSILLPSLFFFFEKVFGGGPFRLITKYKKIQIYFAVVYMIALFLSFYSEGISNIYYSVGYICFGISLVIGNVLLIVSLMFECRNKNKEAIILSAGISIFAGVGLIEILWFLYIDSMYQLFYWKLSILCFLAALIIILVRRVMHNYKQAVEYSKEIEIFNNELQRSEKIELISNLAASIAHEVRNPLQVTRGFLQLLEEKSRGSKESNYMSLAITELDRAAEIITDFLTFAKPDLGGIVKMNVNEEIQQIVGILAPLATLHGGVIVTQPGQDFSISGNPSRFKQALINIIKNSIEAFGDGGEVKISISKYADEEKIVICIEDNGEGIAPDDLKRLGEPYYSKKNKGTGLGLMVTYRIIEAMNGEIQFQSEKGRGTSAFISIPSA